MTQTYALVLRGLGDPMGKLCPKFQNLGAKLISSLEIDSENIMLASGFGLQMRILKWHPQIRIMSLGSRFGTNYDYADLKSGSNLGFNQKKREVSMSRSCRRQKGS